MSDYLEKARELGQAVVESDVYTDMRLAEQAAMADAEAVRLITAVAEQRKKVEAQLAQDPVDPVALSREGETMRTLEAQMKALPIIACMQEKRQAFSQMMNDVNAVLRYVINGEDPDTENCSGNCQGCSGCH